MALIPSQTYEDLLGDALEELIARKVDSLEEFADGLNELNVRAPMGQRWTADLLGDELKRLGS